MTNPRTFVVVFAMSLCWPAFSTGAETIGAFQGLPWGATEEQIEKQFPRQLARNTCQGTLAKFQRVGKRACDNPFIDSYDINGIPFKLSFALAEDTRTLIEVVLFYSGEPRPPPAGLTIDQAWRVRSDQLREALEVRYGAPIYSSPHMGTEKFSMYSATWHSHDTEIELSTTLSRSDRTGDNERYQVWYKPRGGRDSSKL